MVVPWLRDRRWVLDSRTDGDRIAPAF